jgi:hypothetical protein
MELDQVVYEYGKLQLNFVACQRQNTSLATQLALANKQVSVLTKERQISVARVAQLEKAWPETYLVPPVPEPVKDEPPNTVEQADPGTGTDLGRGVMAGIASQTKEVSPRSSIVKPVKPLADNA